MTEQQTAYGAKTRVRFPEHPEIFKVQNPDGSRNYCREHGEEVKTHDCDLYYYLTDSLLHFDAITELLEDNKYSYLYKTLINHFFREFATLVHFLEKEFGSIIKVQITDSGINEQVIGVSSSFQKPSEKERSQDMERERDLRVLQRFDKKRVGIIDFIKGLEGLFQLSDRDEQNVTIFNKLVDDFADRLKQAFAEANS